MSSISTNSSSVAPPRDLGSPFPIQKDFPNEVTVTIFKNLGVITLSKIQLVSKKWQEIINEHFQDQIKEVKVKLFNIFHMFLEDSEKPFVNRKSLYNLIANLSKEELSKFANLKINGNTPLYHAISTSSENVITLLVDSIPKEEQQKYLNNKLNDNMSAWELANDLAQNSDDDIPLNTLKPYMKS